MQRSKKSSRLMSSLSLLLLTSHAARANQPARQNGTSGGWAIIFASDYKGPTDPLFVSAQYDAIVAYRTLVADMHYDPDHIVILVDGDKTSPLEGFLKERDTPPKIDGKDGFKKAEGWQHYDANPNRVSKQIDALDTPAISTELRLRISDFRDFRVAGSQIPFFGSATVKNFRAARDVISKLAKDGDSVTVVISAHANPNPNVIAANPGEDSKKDGDNLDPNDCLKAEDITLPGCKASIRMLVLDNSLRYYDESIEPAPAAENEKKFASLVKSAFATDKSVVLMASDGTGVSWPKSEAGEGGKYLLTGSAFLQSTFQAIHASPDSNCEEYISKSKMMFKGSMIGLKLNAATQWKVKPIAYKPLTPFSDTTSVGSKHMVALLNTPVSEIAGEKQQLVSYGKVDMNSRIPNSNGLYQLRIQGSVMGNISGDRKEKIGARLKALLSNPLTSLELNDDQTGIRAGKAHGLDVVKMPAAVKYNDEKDVDYLVTVDDRFAKMIGEPKPFNLPRIAEKLAKKFRKALTVKGQNTLAGDDPAPVEWQGMGIEKYNAHEYPLAAQFFSNALSRDNTLFNSYVWLSHSLLKIGRNDLAKQKLEEMFAVMNGLGESPEKFFEPDQAKLVKELTAQLGVTH